MLVPVVLAGGLGTRLWPVSRREYPKPLIRFTGEYSLLQQTVLRAAALTGAGRPTIVCGEMHYPHILDQMEEIGHSDHDAVLEPVGRGTAPAAAAAALSVDSDDVLLILPADHAIRDEGAFRRAVRSAVEAAGDGWLVTFGVTPDRAETGYGYIERGAALEAPADGYRIASFREKPDRATARRYLATGRFAWNSGMFVFGAGGYLDELGRLEPAMVRRIRQAMTSADRDAAGPGPNLLLLEREALSTCPPGSIDRTVMERTAKGAVIPLEAGWNDVGTWAALWETGLKDADGNVASGRHHLKDVSSSYVSAGDRPVVVIGLEGVVVVDAGDAVLVASMDRAQEVGPVAR